MSVTFALRQGRTVDWEDGINLSNSNAREVLDSLDIDSPELCGDIRGRDLLEKCKSALSYIQPGDKAKPTLAEHSVNHPTIVYCGRDAGYITQRINQLIELATRAGDIGVIVWG